MSALCKEDAPLIVLYSPPFYPAVSSKDDQLIRNTADQLRQYAADRYGIALREVQYFPGLSDLSYLRLEKQEVDAYTSNMPLFNRGYSSPSGKDQALYVPVLNVGPAGKDPHKWTERLYLPYSFEVLPDLLSFTIVALLKQSETAGKLF